MSPELPISAILRQRIITKKIQFRAQDNISEAIGPGDLDLLIEEVSEKIERVLQSLVIDTASDHNTHDTCRRVAKMFILEVFHGRYFHNLIYRRLQKRYLPVGSPFLVQSQYVVFVPIISAQLLDGFGLESYRVGAKDQSVYQNTFVLQTGSCRGLKFKRKRLFSFHKSLNIEYHQMGLLL